MRIPNPVAMFREKRRKHDDAAEIEKLSAALRGAVEKYNNARPVISVNETSDMEAILDHAIDVEEQLEIIHEAYMTQDLDALKVYVLFAPDDKLCTKRVLKETIEMLYRFGHRDLHKMERSVFQNAGLIYKALMVERKDHDSKMRKHFIEGGDLGYALMEHALLTVCALGPERVVEYLLEDTMRALNLVGDRRITDHEELIDVIELALTSEAPILVDGML